jgi:hypothetical protein
MASAEPGHRRPAAQRRDAHDALDRLALEGLTRRPGEVGLGGFGLSAQAHLTGPGPAEPARR